MAVFRVEKNKNFTVMSNIHLRDKNLSLKAKGLLSLILSLPETWQYSIRGLASISKESEDSVATGLKELERAGYLTRHQLRGKHGRMGQVEYVIYESPQLCSPLPENPGTVTPCSADPSPEIPAQTSTEKGTREKDNTDLYKNPIKSHPASEELSADKMRLERAAYKELFLENIEYDFLKSDLSPVEDLEELIEIALDAICATKPFQIIGGNKIPTDVVRSRLLKLNSEHIRYVLDCLQGNTTTIRNIRQYLLSSLYNAPATISNYYTTLVNHDMKEMMDHQK